MFEENSKSSAFSWEVLRQRNVLRCEKQFPMCADWTVGDWGNAVAGEVGELCNMLKKVRRGEPSNMEAIGKEIADVIIYLDLIAAHFGIDVEKAVKDKFNEVSRRVNSPYFI